MRTILKALLRSAGYKLIPYSTPTNPREINQDITDAEWATWQSVEPYTMTSLERVLAAIRATIYVSENAVPGDIVECGVWRGGSSMAMAQTLQQRGDTSRQFYLFDTFQGMTEPTDADIDPNGRDAAGLMATADDRDASWMWARATLEDVQANLAKTGYPENKVKYIKGPVEETIPASAPGAISILRLDTDWYESTKHELEHLYHRLSPGGVLIIDDYGHWQGARQAVDEFFRGKAFLGRIDYSGRFLVKPHSIDFSGESHPCRHPT